MNRLLSLLLGGLLVSAAPAVAGDHSIPEATPETFFGKPENLQLVATATEITVYRIVDSEQKPRRRKTVEIDNCWCDPASTKVTGSEVTQVVAALSDMGNFGGMLMCDFDPGVIIRFGAAGRTVDLIVCFHCGAR